MVAAINNTVKILCTDANPVYKSLIEYYGVELKIKYHIAKVATSLVESWNCILRHYLARLKRRTLCYSKGIEMLLNKEGGSVYSFLTSSRLFWKQFF